MKEGLAVSYLELSGLGASNGLQSLALVISDESRHSPDSGEFRDFLWRHADSSISVNVMVTESTVQLTGASSTSTLINSTPSVVVEAFSK